MHGRPRNLASDQIRRRYPDYDRIPEMSETELQALGENYADDFVREDRRSFVTIPSASFEDFIASLRSYWELGGGAPSFTVAEVIAVRGQRLVLFRSRIEFDDERSTESLVVLEYDGRMRAKLATMFDADDREAALLELDRRHALTH